MSHELTSEAVAARLALDAFGVPADAVVDFVKHRENHVYRVRTPDWDRSLRMHRVGYRTDDELRSETASMVAFRAGGIAVPTPVATADGDHVVTVVDPQGVRRQATMQDWIADGRVFGDSAAVFAAAARPSDGELRMLGSLIARMHDVAAAGAPAGYTRAAWNADGLAGPAALWGSASRLSSLSIADRVTLERADTRLRADLAELATTPDRFGVIHADFTFENVLVTDDGLVALDFDDSGEGWFLFDLTTPAFWCARHLDGPSMIAALAEGYRKVRPLPDQRGWHALLLARALSYLGWAADRPGDPASDFHERVVAPWVVAAARRYLKSGETGWPPLALPPIEGVTG
jgi:Ser/Thr protein kinase RdoA (MazF antagonist)